VLPGLYLLELYVVAVPAPARQCVAHCAPCRCLSLSHIKLPGVLSLSRGWVLVRCDYGCIGNRLFVSRCRVRPRVRFQQRGCMCKTSDKSSPTPVTIALSYVTGATVLRGIPLLIPPLVSL
jgi:hypothetical protein